MSHCAGDRHILIVSIRMWHLGYRILHHRETTDKSVPNPFATFMPPSKSSRRLAVFLLRFLISKNEYERLEVILSPYTPNSIRPHLPSTADFDEQRRSQNSEVGIVEAALGPRDEFLPATVRQGSRVFVGTYVAATLVDVVLVGIIKKHRSSYRGIPADVQSQGDRVQSTE